MTDTTTVFGWIGAAVGAGPALTLAQFVIDGGSLTGEAQLALIFGIIITQLLSVMLAHVYRVRQANKGDEDNSDE